MALVVTSAEAPAPPLLPFASADNAAAAVAAACRVRGTPEAHLQFSCRNRDAAQARCAASPRAPKRLPGVAPAHACPRRRALAETATACTTGPSRCRCR